MAEKNKSEEIKTKVLSAEDCQNIQDANRKHFLWQLFALRNIGLEDACEIAGIESEITGYMILSNQLMSKMEGALKSSNEKELKRIKLLRTHLDNEMEKYKKHLYTYMDNLENEIVAGYVQKLTEQERDADSEDLFLYPLEDPLKEVEEIEVPKEVWESGEEKKSEEAKLLLDYNSSPSKPIEECEKINLEDCNEGVDANKEEFLEKIADINRKANKDSKNKGKFWDKVKKAFGRFRKWIDKNAIIICLLASLIAFGLITCFSIAEMKEESQISIEVVAESDPFTEPGWLSETYYADKNIQKNYMNSLNLMEQNIQLMLAMYEETVANLAVVEGRLAVLSEIVQPLP